METAKPYLMNCIRMPAAQTLLLFSYSIHTNSSITRVVCDSWLCLEFPTPETGCELLRRAIKLRRLWNQSLMQKLAGESTNFIVFTPILKTNIYIYFSLLKILILKLKNKILIKKRISAVKWKKETYGMI